MSLYTIVGIIVCILLVNFTEKEFTEARIRSERFHVRHQGIYRQLRRVRHLIESSNQWRSKNLSKINDDGAVWMNSIAAQRKRRNLEIINDGFVVEVSRLQNASICNYTIEPVGEIFGSRVLSNLHHIKCNPTDLGNRCQSNKPHCCIQTYEIIDLPIPNKANEPVTIYTGCVCAHLHTIKAKNFKMKGLDY
ncbi:uncharacterized protein LOC117243515 [Bombus vosnesenskii]|uniref:Uncharacterized protein LOC117243515 n=1 Tax=Bombus vosnesenskii TaxID=207650 RepID=A0A6J3LNA1_9HYME|nr:uncharacterized protein LOC117243515 [Bombus vosnesenskii]